MKVTNELLGKFKAYRKWFDVLKKYEGAAELVDLIRDTDLNFEDLYFARHYFSFTEDELSAYNERCHIDQCGDHVLSSSFVSCSNWIYSSDNIKNSDYVNNSELVEKSQEIVNSINIQYSNDIINSKNISYSQRIADSDEIYSSNDILNSSKLSWCKVINSSFNLVDCEFMYKCREDEDCYFCGFVTGCSHCLFCSNLSNEKYCIFNQPVTPNEFYQIKEILLLQLQNESVDLLNIEEKSHLNNRFHYDLRFDRMFEKLSEDFYGWVGQLPQFDEQVFLILFFTTLK